MKQSITITGVNINDIFKMECVKSAWKYEGSIAYVLYQSFVDSIEEARDEDYVLMMTVAFLGDTLVQLDNGKWTIKRKETE